MDDIVPSKPPPPIKFKKDVSFVQLGKLDIHKLPSNNKVKDISGLLGRSWVPPGIIFLAECNGDVCIIPKREKKTSTSTTDTEPSTSTSMSVSNFDKENSVENSSSSSSMVI